MGPALRFGLCVLAVLVGAAQTYPDMGGAQIEKPFQSTIKGAVCFTGTGPIAGNAYFHFPTQDKKALSFVIGPSAPRQDKNDPFTGPGTYKNIGIFVKAASDEDSDLSGFGQIVVNEDGRSGTFSFNTSAKASLTALQKAQPKKDQKNGAKDKTQKDGGDDSDSDDDDGAVSGTWDCGRKLGYEKAAGN